MMKKLSTFLYISGDARLELLENWIIEVQVQLTLISKPQRVWHEIAGSSLFDCDDLAVEPPY